MLICTVHSDLCKKDISFFRLLEEKIKKQKGSEENSPSTNKKITESSYFIAHQVAKTTKPHTIAEQLIKPCLIAIIELIFEKAASDKMEQVSVSKNTIQLRIKDMSQDILLQVNTDLQHTSCFSPQIDESTDVAQCSQLLCMTDTSVKIVLRKNFSSPNLSKLLPAVKMFLR